METLDYIAEILKRSIERHGEIPLTTKHLLNIIQLAERNAQEEDYRAELEGGWE